MSYNYRTGANSNRRYSIPESRFSDLSNDQKQQQRRDSFDYAQYAEFGNASNPNSKTAEDDSRQAQPVTQRGCAGRSRRFICAITCCGLLVLLLLASILAYFIFIPQIIKSRLEDPALFQRLLEQSRQETDPALRPKISVAKLKLGIDGEPGLAINLDADALVPAVPVSVSLNPGNWVVGLNDAPIVEFKTPALALSASTPAKITYNERIKLSGLDRINKFVREFGLADAGVSGEVGKVSIATTLDYAVLGIPMRNVEVKIQVDATGAKFATVRPLILRGNFRLADFFDFQVTNANIDVIGSSVNVQAAIDLDNKTPLDVGISTFSLTSQLEGLSPITITTSGIRIRPGKSTFNPSSVLLDSFRAKNCLALSNGWPPSSAFPRSAPGSIHIGRNRRSGGSRASAMVCPAHRRHFHSHFAPRRIAPCWYRRWLLGSGLAAKVLSTLSVDVAGRGSNLAISARSQVDLPSQLPANINLANASVSLNVLSGSTQLFNLGVSNFTLRPEVGGTVRLLHPPSRRRPRGLHRP
ncbi:hypothetical protein BCR44DRAFT_1025660 [Catenaria anguillulae PL171]|uniref:Uncharacterized protein n=1 Tax=Catenaria anguillulae PL171 TaxID=765915 RepID=A0A1Y2HT69_9FUNG|nr:hypothetical protein BCR44DRAFT_1025660 [Catenaria anguillulae PL171]